MISLLSIMRESLVLFITPRLTQVELSDYAIPSIVAANNVDFCSWKIAAESRGYSDPIMPVDVKQVHIGVRSRFRVWLLRVFFKRLMERMGRGSEERIALLQVKAAGRLPEQCSGLNLQYRIINGVPGPMLGDSRDIDKLAILYLHGGAFVFPASPALQVEFSRPAVPRLERYRLHAGLSLDPTTPRSGGIGRLRTRLPRLAGAGLPTEAHCRGRRIRRRQFGTGIAAANPQSQPGIAGLRCANIAHYRPCESACAAF